MKVRQGLKDWFYWHRTTQLAGIEVLIRQLQVDALAATTPAQVCRWSDALSDHLTTAYEHGIPAIAEIAMSLRPEQISKLASRYEANNAKFKEEYLQASFNARLRESIKRFTERAEDFYGPLNAEQRTAVRRRTAESPFDPELWLVERRARQQDILNSLQRWADEKTAPGKVRAQLLLLGRQMRQSSRENYRAYQQRLFDYNCALVAEVHNAATPAQRQRLVDKLKDWESDIHLLMGDIDS